MIAETIKLQNDIFVNVKESNDDELGFIIDVFKGDELIDTYTYWYDDF